MLIFCRSKVTFVLALDPLQKQGLGHSLVLTPCRSKVTIILYFSTPCRSKVTIILWYVDPLQKQGHICLLALDPLQKQGLGHSLFSSSCAKGLKVVSTLYFSVHVWEKTQSSLHILFYFIFSFERNQLFCLYLSFTLIIWKF